MATKMSTIVDDRVWKELRQFSDESGRSIAGIVTEALDDYLKRKQVRPEFLQSMKESADDNEVLGHLLAK